MTSRTWSMVKESLGGEFQLTVTSSLPTATVTHIPKGRAEEHHPSATERGCSASSTGASLR
jgi:hypothetical protein